MFFLVRAVFLCVMVRKSLKVKEAELADRQEQAQHKKTTASNIIRHSAYDALPWEAIQNH
eukprot:5176216-Amphidinium_carterae.1